MNPYDFNPWAQTSQNIGTYLMQIPAMRAQAQMGKMQGQVYAAQAGKLDQETQALVQKARVITEMENNFAGAMSELNAGQPGQSWDNFGRALTAYGAMHGANPSDMVKTMGMAFQQRQAAMAKDPTQMQAATTGRAVPFGQAVTAPQWEVGNAIAAGKIEQDNATRVQIAQMNNEARAQQGRRLIPVAPGTSLFDVDSRTVAYGNSKSEPQKLDPVASEKIKYISRYGNTNMLGEIDKAAKAAQTAPAAPAKPAAPSAPAAPPAAPGKKQIQVVNGRVNVYNPQGQMVSLSVEDLEEATKPENGYRLP